MILAFERDWLACRGCDCWTVVRGVAGGLWCVDVGIVSWLGPFRDHVSSSSLSWLSKGLTTSHMLRAAIDRVVTF
jgi:hypothetical protein